MKVNESTNAANLLMVGMQAKNDVIEDAMDFANILSDVADTKQSSVSYDRSKEAVKETTDYHMQNASTDSNRQAADKTVETNPNQTTQKAQTDSYDEKEQPVDLEQVADEENLPEETVDMEKAMEVLGSLLNEISEIFHISLEDLSKAANDLGFSAMDLLDVNNMKQLLLTVNQIDSTELLVNEDLNSRFRKILSELDNLLESFPDLPANIEVTENDIPVDALIDFVSDNQSLMGKNVEGMDDTLQNMVHPEGVEEPIVIVEDNRTGFSNENSKGNQQSESELSDTIQKDSKTVSNQTAQAKEPAFENPILQNIQDSFSQIEEVSMVSDSGIVSTDQIIHQIVEQVKIQMNQDNTSLQMQLYPEHLGKIQINIVSKDGIMTAQIVAENDAAKQAIEGGLSSLKESLENQNMKVDAIEVMVSTAGFQQNDNKNGFTENQSNTRRGRKLNLSELEDDDLEPEDAAEVEKMKATGSSVSYSI